MFTRERDGRLAVVLLAAPFALLAACESMPDDTRVVQSPSAYGDDGGDGNDGAGGTDGGCPSAPDCDGGDGDGQTPLDTVADGFDLELHLDGLDYPTAIAFGDLLTQSDPASSACFISHMFVAESGITGIAKIKAMSLAGDVVTLLAGDQLAEGMLMPPLTDITIADDVLWIAHRQAGANGWAVGAVSVLDPADPVGSFRTVLTNLPSSGDHSVNEVLMGADGMAYITLGTATNSSVVGPDNRWLEQYPDFHDYPAQDIYLSGVAYETGDPLTEDPNDTVITSPFAAFGRGALAAETLVPAASPAAPRDGIIAGNGSVYRFDPVADDAAATLELVAWGLRNSFGLALAPDDANILYITNNGADVRGVAGEVTGQGDLEGEIQLEVTESRPIANDWDDLFRVDLSLLAQEPLPGCVVNVPFFGWPDYFHDELTMEARLVTDPMFCEPTLGVELSCPQPVLHERTRDLLHVENAVAQFELHSSANKLDIALDDAFRAEQGDMYVAETGSFFAVTGTTSFVGYKVVRVDRANGRVTDFISAGATQAEIFEPSQLNKPIDVKFDGGLMYIVDFGVFEPGLGLEQAGTGKVWVVRAATGEEPEEPEEPGEPDMPGY